MKAVIFDMHGVIMKEPNGNLMPFVNQKFPQKTFEDVYPFWAEVSLGKCTSHEYLQMIGFEENLPEIEQVYLDTLEFDKEFIKCATILKKRYRLALLSNDVSEWSLYIRNKYGLDKFFDVIVISGDVGMKKPFPDIYEYTLQQLNQPANECFFIDDRPGNLIPAAKLGIKPILFNKANVEYNGESVTNFDDLLVFLNAC